MRQRCPATVTRVRNGRARGCSSAGRRARQQASLRRISKWWAPESVSASPAGETRARSTGVVRVPPHLRSVSARRGRGSARGADRRESGRRGWVRAGWPQWPSHTPGRGRGSPPAGVGRRHRLHPRRPMRRGHWRRPRGRSVWQPVLVWSQKPAGRGGFPLLRSGHDHQPRTVVGTGLGRSGRVRVGLRRSDTPPPGSSQPGPRYRCIRAAPRPNGCLS